MRYAIVSDGIVQQIVLWDGKSGWTPPAGTQAIACDDTTRIGDAFDGKAFTAPLQAVGLMTLDTPAPSAIGPDGLTDDERATFKALLAKVLT